jgi:hypothetical protein
LSSGKPTYSTLFSSLKTLRGHVIANDVKKLAMPRIGCGLDFEVTGRKRFQKQRRNFSPGTQKITINITFCWKGVGQRREIKRSIQFKKNLVVTTRICIKLNLLQIVD